MSLFRNRLSKFNWLIHFSIHPAVADKDIEPLLSPKSRALQYAYNKLGRELKESLLKDKDSYRKDQLICKALAKAAEQLVAKGKIPLDKKYP
jgi:hypothetical protein